MLFVEFPSSKASCSPCASSASGASSFPHMLIGMSAHLHCSLPFPESPIADVIAPRKSMSPSPHVHNVGVFAYTPGSECSGTSIENNVRRCRWCNTKNSSNRSIGGKGPPSAKTSRMPFFRLSDEREFFEPLPMDAFDLILRSLLRTVSRDMLRFDFDCSLCLRCFLSLRDDADDTSGERRASFAFFFRRREENLEVSVCDRDREVLRLLAFGRFLGSREGGASENYNIATKS